MSENPREDIPTITFVEQPLDHAKRLGHTVEASGRENEDGRGLIEWNCLECKIVLSAQWADQIPPLSEETKEWERRNRIG